jgi:hypothetical protein
MKITKQQLKELIRGQVAATLEEAWKDVEGEYFPPHSEETYAPEETKEEDYYDDSLHRGYDEDIAAIDQAFRNLAFSVIDEYKGHKSFDKNAARREILDTLQAAVDNFVEGGGGPNVIDLPKILADEFKEEDPDAEWMDDEASLRQQDWPEDLKEAGELTNTLSEAEDLNPADVNVYLLRIVSGVHSLGKEPPDHSYGGRRGVTPHAKWKQKKEKVDQAIAKINNGEYTEEQLASAEEQAATIPPHFGKLETNKAFEIEQRPGPEPKSKIGRVVSKLKDRFGIEEALK